MCNIVKVLELSGQEAQGFTQPFTFVDADAHKRASEFKSMLKVRNQMQTHSERLISGTYYIEVSRHLTIHIE